MIEKVGLLESTNKEYMQAAYTQTEQSWAPHLPLYTDAISNRVTQTGEACFTGLMAVLLCRDFSDQTI